MPLPPFKDFLTPENYITDFAEGAKADCTTVSMVFRLAARLCDLPQLSSLHWLPQIDDLTDDQFLTFCRKMPSNITAVRMEEVLELVSAFFAAGLRFGMLTSHSASPWYLDARPGQRTQPGGHWLTILQVEGRFRLVHAFAVRPLPVLFSLEDWLVDLQPEWLDSPGIWQEWTQWMRVCAEPTTEEASNAATALFRKRFHVRQFSSMNPEPDMTNQKPDPDMSVTIIQNIEHIKFLQTFEVMLSEMHEASSHVSITHR